MAFFGLFGGKKEIPDDKKKEYINASTGELRAAMDKLDEQIENPQLTATDKVSSNLSAAIGLEPLIGGAAGALGASYLEKPVRHLAARSFRTDHTDSGKAVEEVLAQRRRPGNAQENIAKAYIEKAEEGLLKAGATAEETAKLAENFASRLGKTGKAVGLAGLVGGVSAGAAWAMHKANKEALEGHRDDSIIERKFVKQLIAEREQQANSPAQGKAGRA